MKYNFSKDLKGIREILNLSQSEIADKIGVEQITISRSEAEKTYPSMNSMSLCLKGFK